MKYVKKIVSLWHKNYAFMKKTNFFLMAFMIAISYFLLTSGRSKSGIPVSTPIPAVQEGNVSLALYGTTSLPWSSDRKYNYPCPVQPFLGSEPSATALSNSPNSKYYCVVTVECIGNSSWGNQGKRTFVWDVTGNTKTIQAPKNYQFKVSVNFYERCGAHYTSGGYGRTIWTTSSGTTGYSTVMGLSNWSQLGKMVCY